MQMGGQLRCKRVGKWNAIPHTDYPLPCIAERTPDPARLESKGRGNFEQNIARTRGYGDVDERQVISKTAH